MNKTTLLLIWLLIFSFGNCAAEPFTNNGDDTITDTGSGLVWQQTDDNVKRTWQDALDYCAASALPGTGWRLPNIKELFSIVDYTKKDPAIDPIFTGTTRDEYWTSTTYGAGSEPWSAIYVHFLWGSSYRSSKSTTHLVRCVR